MRYVISILMLMLFLTACSSPQPATTRPSFETLLTNIDGFHPTPMEGKALYCFIRDQKELDEAAYREACRRFVNPVVFICHGGDSGKEWILKPDDLGVTWNPEQVAKALAEMYPDRDIVLNACNPGHYRINVPRVWYFLNNVWSLPDTDVFENERKYAPFYSRYHTRDTIRHFGGDGSIWEAVTQNSTSK